MENVRTVGQVEIIRRDWRKVLLVALGVFLLGIIITVFQPFMYRSTVSIYVVQKSGFSIDAYSASKSEERFANKLGQLVYSSTFLDKVLAVNNGIDKTYFPQDEQKRRQKWGKTIEANVPTGLSRLDLAIYHPIAKEALSLAESTAQVLLTQRDSFIGISDVSLLILDKPLVSKYPVRPNIPVNLIASIFVGLLVGVSYVSLTYDPQRDKLFGFSYSKPSLIRYNDFTKETVFSERYPVKPLQESELKAVVKEVKLQESIQKAQEIADDLNKETKSEKDNNGLEVQDFAPQIPDLSTFEQEISSDELAVQEKDDLDDFEDEDKIVTMK